MKPIKTQRGWEIWDGFAFEPDSTVYATKREAAQAAAIFDTEAAAWNRTSLSDAPHTDNVD